MASLSPDRPTLMEVAIRHAVIAGKLRARLPGIDSARLARSVSRLADASSAASREALEAALPPRRDRS
jgi:hypothetical protein